jgi:hypothetical protein
MEKCQNVIKNISQPFTNKNASHLVISKGQ